MASDAILRPPGGHERSDNQHGNQTQKTITDSLLWDHGSNTLLRSLLAVGLPVPENSSDEFEKHTVFPHQVLPHQMR